MDIHYFGQIERGCLAGILDRDGCHFCAEIIGGEV
jgi:hypothetical protein